MITCACYTYARIPKNERKVKKKMKKIEDRLSEILNRPENLYGIDYREVQRQLLELGYTKAEIKVAKSNIGVITCGFPASQDGQRKEQWLWMRR